MLAEEFSNSIFGGKNSKTVLMLNGIMAENGRGGWRAAGKLLSCLRITAA